MALFGLKSKVQIAPVETNGSLPDEENWVDLCRTYRDTVEIIDADPTVEEEYSDQEDDPIAVFTEAGKTEGKFSTFEFDNNTLADLFPEGTTVNGGFSASNSKGFETAIRFKTDSEHVISYAKVKLTVKKNIRLQKKAVALIDCLFTPMSPIHIAKTA